MHKNQCIIRLLKFRTTRNFYLYFHANMREGVLSHQPFYLFRRIQVRYTLGAFWLRFGRRAFNPLSSLQITLFVCNFKDASATQVVVDGWEPDDSCTCPAVKQTGRHPCHSSDLWPPSKSRLCSVGSRSSSKRHTPRLLPHTRRDREHAGPGLFFQYVCR